MLKVSWLRRKLHYDLILTSKNIIIKNLAYPWCVSIEDCFLKIKYIFLLSSSVREDR